MEHGAFALCTYGSEVRTPLPSFPSAFCFAQASNVRTVDEIWGYLKVFLATTYAMSNAIIDATTFDDVHPDSCLAQKGVCTSGIWRNFSASFEEKHTPDGRRHNMVFSKKTASEDSSRGLLFSEMEFTRSTISVLSPLVFQTYGSWEPCSTIGKLYNEQLNQTTFKSGPVGRAETFDVRYAGWHTGSPVGAVCVDRNNPNPPEKTFSFYDWEHNRTKLDLAKEDLARGTEQAYTLLQPGHFPKANILGVDYLYEFVDSIGKMQAANFLDARTREVSIATVLFTAQPEAYADIATLLIVTFTHGQYGKLVGVPAVYNVSQTSDSWYYLVGVAIFSCVAYFVSSVFSALAMLRSGASWWQPRMWQFDIVLSLGSLGYLQALLLTDRLPPHCFDTENGFMAKAFQKATEEGTCMQE